MDEKLIRTFLAVAQAQSFHRAAEQLHVTQAAVSARIRALEEALDVALFLRGRGGTRLTEAGVHLRPHAEQLLAQWQQVRAGMGRQYANRIALRLGCQLSIWDSLLVDLTIWAEDTLGKLPLSLNFDHDSRSIDMVRDGRVDLVVTGERPFGQSLAAVALAPEYLRLMSSRPGHVTDPDLPRFLDLQLGPEHDAAAREQLGHRDGHLFLGNASMALHYLRHQGGMAFLPARMAEGLFPIKGAEPFEIARFAVYDPAAPAAEMVTEVLPGLKALMG